MRNILLLFGFYMLFGFAIGQQSIRVMHYNLLQFGNPCNGVDLKDKYDWLGTILDHHKPDIFTVNEIGENPLFSNAIKSVSFDYSSTIEYGPTSNKAGSDIVNRLFYNTGKILLLQTQTIDNNLRDINVYELYIKGSGLNEGNDSLKLTCIVAHFKAQNNASSASQRAVAAQSVMNWIQANGQGKHVMLLGDLNIYNPAEAAFQTIVFNNNEEIRLLDATGKSSGWGGSGNAIVHTQSTRSNSPDCGSGGGMDDRFDMILMNRKLMEDSSGLHYVDGTYAAFGNDGNSYNQELNCSGNTVVPVSVCLALRQMSDHLPVVVELVAEGVVSIQKDYLLKGIQIKVLGNPVGEHLQLLLEYEDEKAVRGNYFLEVFDASGRIVSQLALEFTNEEISINTSFWGSGLYLIKLRDREGRWISRAFLKR